MNRFARVNPFFRFPGWSLLAVILVSVPAFLELGNLQVRSDAETLLQNDQRNLEAYEKVSEILKRDTVVVIGMESDRLFTREGLAVVRRLSGSLQRMDGCTGVKSLTHSVKPVRRGLSFSMVPFVPEDIASEEELGKIREFCVTHPLVKNIMVAPDARHTVITANFRRDLSKPGQQRAFRREIELLVDGYRSPRESFRTIAIPFVAEEIRDSIRRDVRVLAPAILAITVIILVLALRSLVLSLLAVLHLGASLAVVAGVYALAGKAVTFQSLMLFPLLAGLVLTLVAHVFIAWKQAMAGTDDPVAGLAQAGGAVFKSCAFASLTTVAGMLSLGVSEMSQVRDFGLMGALGIAVIFVWIFGPAIAVNRLVARAGGVRPAVARTTTSGFSRLSPTDLLTSLLRNRREWILGVVVVLTGIAVAGGSKLRTDTRVVEFLDPDSSTRRTVEMFDRVFGGINLVQFEIDSGADNGVNRPAFLKYVEAVQQFADRQEEVSMTYSYAQLLAMMNQIWEGGAVEALKLPEGPMKLSLFVTALRLQEYPFLKALADGRFRTAYVIVRSRDMPSREYLGMIEQIVGFAEEEAPEGVTVSARKGIHSILEAERRIFRAQLQAVALTLGAVFVVLFFLWGSFRLPVLAVAVNVLAVSWVIGAAGYAAVSLNAITVMVAPLALAIAIDDSVHLITAWRDASRRGLEAGAALAEALRIKAPPIVCTSLILVSVFGAFQLFSFPPARQFGLLSALAMVAALATVLVLLPVLLPGPGTRMQKEEPTAAKEAGSSGLE